MMEASKRRSKRLVFDRRYGWVIDEWKDPSEQALAGGRGMFCIVPLAKELFKTTKHSIKLAASAAMNVIERPDLLSLEVLQASINDQLHGLGSLFQVQKSRDKLYGIQGISLANPIDFSSHMNTKPGITLQD